MLALLAAVVAVAASSGHASTAFARQDVTVTMADGTPIAATLWLPAGTPPAGGWPAIVLFHGLGGSRKDMNTLAKLAFLPGDHYAVLAYDARGHGQSGGLIGIDGPNEISDAKVMFDWLASRPDVNRKEIGAFGISYGGGAVWNSLVAGVPWAAIEVCETWTNLASALVPQGLAKSGVIGAFVNEVPLTKFDPAVLAIERAAFAGDLAGVGAFSAARSSIQKLKGVKTPVFMMQGRRDFAFGLDQAFSAWPLLAGPKHLWIGLHGHPPSSFPAPDTTAMLTEGRQWFDHYLRGVKNGIDKKPPVEVAPVAWKGKTVGYRSPDKIARDEWGARSYPSSLTVTRTIGPSGRIRLAYGPTPSHAVDVFGAPTVGLTATATAGWSRLVAVLTATTRSGQTIVISGGGVPTRPGKHAYLIRLLDEMTYVPAGSRLTLTLGASSLAQDPADLLYLQLPMPDAARISVIGRVNLSNLVVDPGY
jgi:pimeloyl-ACP methyl ester carboxylesterase